MAPCWFLINGGMLLDFNIQRFCHFKKFSAEIMRDGPE